MLDISPLDGIRSPFGQRRGGGPAPAFSPTALYSSGSQGIWLDPSDLSTMFSDRAGTTPVTAPGTVVGLRLDKSKGLTLGSELVVNGDFAAGTTGWTAINSALAVVGGQLEVSVASSGNSYSRTYQVLTTSANATYQVDIFVGSGTSDVNNIYVLLDGAVPGNNGIAQIKLSVGANRLFFRAVNTTTYFAPSFYCTALGQTRAIGNISVRDLAGNHAVAPTDAARPIYGVEPKGGRRNLLTWSEDYTNAAWSKTGLLTISPNTATAPDGTMTAERLTPDTGSSTKAVRSIVTSAGANTWSFYAKADGYNKIGLWDYATSGAYAAFLLSGAGSVLDSGVGASSPSIASVGNGWYRCSFTATVTGSLGFSPQVLTPAYTTGGVGTAWVGNGTSGILLWGAQLELGSTATAYQRVTTAYDVTESGVATCHYVQYDGSDDSMSTAAIDFTATDKMSVFAGVRKLSDAATAHVLELGIGTQTGSFYLAAPNTVVPASYLWAPRGTNTVLASATGYAAPVSNVVTGLADITGDISTVRVNGVQAATSTADQGPGPFGNYPLFIGRRNNATLPFNGKDYGIIVVGKAASAGETIDTETWLAARTAQVTL